MKKILKSRIFIFLLGVVLAGSIGVYAGTRITADDVEYSEGISVKAKIDDLYTTQSTTVESLNTTINNLNKQNKIIFITSSWKQSSGWNNSGLSAGLYTDSNYLTFASNTVTIKKACKVKITVFVQNAGVTTSAPQYKLYKNGTAILSFSNSSTASNTTKYSTITLNLAVGDTLYAQMNGGDSHPAYFVTYFELSNS